MHLALVVNGTVQMRIRLRRDLAVRLGEISHRARGRVITAAVAASLDSIQLSRLVDSLEELRKVGVNLNQLACRLNTAALIDEQDVRDLTALTTVVRAIIQ